MEEFSLSQVFWIALLFQFLISLFDAYLTWRQYKKIKSVDKYDPSFVSDPKLMDEKKFFEARSYQLDKLRFSLIKTFICEFIEVGILVADGLYLQWYYGVLLTKSLVPEQWQKASYFAGFILVTSFTSKIISLPWELYQTFVIEEKHKMNKQTGLFFVKDLVKNLIVWNILGILLHWPLLYIIENAGPNFYLYLWGFFALVIFFFMTVYLDYIAPIFDKFRFLPDNQLASEIKVLAESLDYPLGKILIQDNSARSAHSNAYLYGMWKHKKIVLFDTILSEEDGGSKSTERASEEDGEKKAKKAEGEDEEKTTQEENEENKPEAPILEEKKSMSRDEILSILGHELGHWKLWHNVQNLVITQVLIFVILYSFSLFIDSPRLFAAFGFTPDKLADGVVPTIIKFNLVTSYIISPALTPFSWFQVAFTRRLEWQADAFSVSLGYRASLRNALSKLGVQNLDFPIRDELYSMFNDSHPTIVQRTKALDQQVEEDKKKQ